MYLDWITYPKSFSLFNFFHTFLTLLSNCDMDFVCLSHFIRINFKTSALLWGSIPKWNKRHSMKKNAQAKPMNPKYLFEHGLYWRSLTVLGADVLKSIFMSAQKKQQQQQQQNTSSIKLNLNFDILAPQMTKGNIQYNSFASHSASQRGSQWLSQLFVSVFHIPLLLSSDSAYV